MESKMIYCKKCKKYKAFYKKDNFWICCGCHRRIDETKESNGKEIRE